VRFGSSNNKTSALLAVVAVVVVVVVVVVAMNPLSFHWLVLFKFDDVRQQQQQQQQKQNIYFWTFLIPFVVGITGLQVYLAICGCSL